MKKIIFITLLFLSFSNISISQNVCIVQSFTIKIDNSVNVPIVNTGKTDNTMTLTHNEQYITDIFSKYIIYGFEKAFPTSTSEPLKSYYKLMCNSKDLINELYEKIPNDFFSIDNNFEGTTFNQEVIDFFDKEVTYNLNEYISTSDAEQCSFNCSLKPIPEDFNISIKVYYETTTELLVLESTKPTSCGNSFKFKFKKKINSTDNKLVLWETVSDTLCFDANKNTNCQIESIFYETIKSNFNLIFSFNQDSFTMKTPNGVFGENVMSFEQKILSIAENKLSESILISPNPVKDVLTLIINEQNLIISKISIFDYSGKKIITANNSFHKINTSSLTSGIYFLQVNSKNGFTIFKKIVKE